MIGWDCMLAGYWRLEYEPASEMLGLDEFLKGYSFVGTTSVQYLLVP